MSTSENLSGVHTLGEPHNSTIESDFEQGKKYYEGFLDSVDHVNMEDMLNLAMASCQRALTHTGTHKERLIKIDILLLMMEIVTLTKIKPEWERERYFYKAVEIARYSHKKEDEDFLVTPHGKRIKEAYCTYIDPKFGENFNNKKCCDFLDLMRFRITAGSDKKIAQRMDQAMDNKSHIAPKDTPKHILEKLEAVLGPVRLVIIAAESGDICMHHRIDRAEAKCLQENSHGIYTTRVEVFHKGKMYQIIIDRGSRESTSMFNDDQREKIIEPMLKSYIERMEHMSFVTHADHSACIRQHEEKQNIGEPRDYSAFIERVLSDTTIKASEAELDTSEDYARSIDIARLMMSYSHGKTPPATSELYEQMDSILGGRINRRVYKMVTSILLSRNETMHGTGYPFGYNQRTISLEAKLYAIIRAYETLCSMHPKHPERIISTLENWSGGGYLDKRLLSLFVATLGESRDVPVREKTILTDYRTERYAPHREGWEQLITLTDEIEGLYDEFRGVRVSTSRQKELIKEIGEKRQKIREIARLENIIIIERHEETKSDVVFGSAPGDTYEPLTPEGIIKAEEKGRVFENVIVQIYASQLPRATETAKIIYQKVNGCIVNYHRSAHMQVIESLNNPPKNRDGLSVSLLSKFISLGEGQKDLEQLVHDIVSSSRQSTHLIITHGDIIRHLLLLIRHLFDKEQFIGLRDRVEQEMVYTYLFRGDRIVDWDLLFSISDWKVMIKMINTLTRRIFGDMFYKRGNRRVNLIRLRDKFLDYIDKKNETDPEKVGRFIQALDDNPLTAHFSAILRTGGLIK